MEQYTLKLKLPKIVQLTEATLRDSERFDMIGRNIFMHTPTGTIVEILHGSEFIFDKEYTEYSFGENPRRTAVLLSKPPHISEEEGMKAMEAIVKWYLKNYEEFDSIDSLDWGMM